LLRLHHGCSATPGAVEHAAFCEGLVLNAAGLGYPFGERADRAEVEQALCLPALDALRDGRAEGLLEFEGRRRQLLRRIGPGHRRHGGPGGREMVAELRLQLGLGAQTVEPLKVWASQHSNDRSNRDVCWWGGRNNQLLGFRLDPRAVVGHPALFGMPVYFQNPPSGFFASWS
jgi:hypothetical protein